MQNGQTTAKGNSKPASSGKILMSLRGAKKPAKTRFTTSSVQPNLEGRFNPGYARHVVYNPNNPNQAFLACDWLGLYTLDISTLPPSQQASWVDPVDPSNSYAARLAYAAKKNLLFVAYGPNGFEIFDNTNPYHLLARYTITGTAVDIALSPDETFVAVAAETGQVQFWNVTDPYNAVWTGTGNTLGAAAYGVEFLNNDQVLVAADVLGLFAFDNIRRTPIALDNLGLPGNALSISLSPDSQIAWTATQNANLYGVSLSNLLQLSVATTIKVGGTVYGSAQQGNILQVAAGDQGLQLWNVLNPFSPAQYGAYNVTPVDTRSVAIHGGQSIIADAANGAKFLQVDQTPQQQANALPILQKQKVVITPNILYYTDPAGNTPGITYDFPAATVKGGWFEYQTAPGVWVRVNSPNIVFTNADISAGRYRIVTDGSTTPFSAQFTASNGAFTTPLTPLNAQFTPHGPPQLKRANIIIPDKGPATLNNLNMYAVSPPITPAKVFWLLDVVGGPVENAAGQTLANFSQADLSNLLSWYVNSTKQTTFSFRLTDGIYTTQVMFANLTYPNEATIIVHGGSGSDNSIVTYLPSGAGIIAFVLFALRVMTMCCSARVMSKSFKVGGVGTNAAESFVHTATVPITYEVVHEELGPETRGCCGWRAVGCCGWAQRARQYQNAVEDILLIATDDAKPTYIDLKPLTSGSMEDGGRAAQALRKKISQGMVRVARNDLNVKRDAWIKNWDRQHPEEAEKFSGAVKKGCCNPYGRFLGCCFTRIHPEDIAAAKTTMVPTIIAEVNKVSRGSLKKGGIENEMKTQESPAASTEQLPVADIEIEELSPAQLAQLAKYSGAGTEGVVRRDSDLDEPGNTNGDADEDPTQIGSVQRTSSALRLAS